MLCCKSNEAVIVSEPNVKSAIAEDVETVKDVSPSSSKDAQEGSESQAHGERRDDGSFGAFFLDESVKSKADQDSQSCFSATSGAPSSAAVVNAHFDNDAKNRAFGDGSNNNGRNSLDLDSTVNHDDDNKTTVTEAYDKAYNKVNISGETFQPEATVQASISDDDGISTVYSEQTPILASKTTRSTDSFDVDKHYHKTHYSAENGSSEVRQRLTPVPESSKTDIYDMPGCFAIMQDKMCGGGLKAIQN